MKTLMRTAFLVVISFIFAVSVVRAGEGALYAAEAPDGASFIRVVNADASGSLAQAEIGGKVIKEVEPLAASSYIYLPAGTYQLKVAGRAIPVQMDKNEFHTVVVLDSGETKVLKDIAFDNPRKALLSFYNLMDEGGVSLRTADGKVAVIESVDSLNVDNREINAVKIMLGAFKSGEPLAKTPLISLQRGKVFSVFAIDVGGAPRLVVAENRVDTSV